MLFVRFRITFDVSLCTLPFANTHIHILALAHNTPPSWWCAFVFSSIKIIAKKKIREKYFGGKEMENFVFFLIWLLLHRFTYHRWIITQIRISIGSPFVHHWIDRDGIAIFLTNFETLFRHNLNVKRINKKEKKLEIWISLFFFCFSSRTRICTWNLTKI